MSGVFHAVGENFEFRGNRLKAVIHTGGNACHKCYFVKKGCCADFSITTTNDYPECFDARRVDRVQVRFEEIKP